MSDPLAKYKFRDELGNPLENCVDYLELLDQLAARERELAEARKKLIIVQSCAACGLDCKCRDCPECGTHVCNLEDRTNTCQELSTALQRLQSAEDALRNFKEDFECDFVMSGIIVDNPHNLWTPFPVHYEAARAHFAAHGGADE
jgi:hypothetical protein